VVVAIVVVLKDQICWFLILAEANLDAGGEPFSSSVARQTEEAFINAGYVTQQSLNQRRRDRGGYFGYACFPAFALHRGALLPCSRDTADHAKCCINIIPVMYIAGEHDSDSDVDTYTPKDLRLVPFNAGKISDSKRLAEVVRRFLQPNSHQLRASGQKLMAELLIAIQWHQMS
jgi:hypothetical protein